MECREYCSSTTYIACTLLLEESWFKSPYNCNYQFFFFFFLKEGQKRWGNDSLGVCASQIGWVEGNIFNQLANDRLRKFQSAANPPIYEIGESDKNHNGFNSAD